MAKAVVAMRAYEIGVVLPDDIAHCAVNKNVPTTIAIVTIAHSDITADI